MKLIRLDLILFHEYFHGDDGAGIRTSHQTGWTGVVAPCWTCLGVPTLNPCWRPIADALWLEL